jgi:hypothetical protein
MRTRREKERHGAAVVTANPVTSRRQLRNCFGESALKA